ncbi:MAG: sigma-70 family RNA polymerase sigma factor [Verrucomicrobiales bacterium]|jgi:RNA polymerase sigma-70 factor (ECF subfamily)|nr:sigma-70 family RNA polymerase sigma factor [Verrucomicrobiales bacterium]
MSMDPGSEFVRLWTRHQAEVERYVYMMIPRAVDAGEVIQEVSVKLWEKWDRYDQSRPFVPWAIRFAWLEVLKWRQRQARERLVFSSSLLEQINAAHEQEAPVMDVRRKALKKCLEKLNPQQRKWVKMRYARHGAVKQEAERTGVRLHKLYYALEKIRGQLLECVGRTMRKEGWSDA